MVRGRKGSEQPIDALSTDVLAGKRRRRQTSNTPSTAGRDHTPEASSQASQRSQSPASDGEQAKPRKRVKRVIVTDEEQLNHELQEAVDHPHSSQADALSVDAISPQTRDKRVRFSDPGPPLTNVTVEVTPQASRTAPPTQLATGLTPHIQRAGLQPTKARKIRYSLPATLPGRAGSQDGGIEELHFTPLRTALDNRQRRRLRRSGLSQEMNEIDEHRKEDVRARRELERLRKQIADMDKVCKELEYQLEVQRQWSIDVHNDTGESAEKTKAMEEELSRLRSEIAEHREREESQQIGLATISEDQDEDMDMGGDFYDDDDDDDGLLLIEPGDINVTEEEMGLREIDEEAEAARAHRTSEEFTEGATQISLPDPHAEDQIHQFEQAISQVSREAADAKAALSILSVELQTLGFTTPAASADVVLTALRTAFREARENLESILPGDPSTTLQNGPFLNALVEHLRRLKNDFDAEAEVAREQTELNRALNAQNKGLIGKLAKDENRRLTLEGQWHQLDTDNERRAKTIAEMEQELDEHAKTIEEQDAVITEQDKTITDLEAELDDQEKSNQKLQTAINSYREEVSKMQALIQRVEDEHKTALEALKAEHEAVVADLNEKLATEKSYREIAEGEIDEKVSFITALELKIEAAETDLDKLRDDLGELRNLKNLEQSQRESAEEELDQKTEDIARLENSVEAAEQSIDQLRTELGTLRNRAENERKQRESAEAQLDASNEKIVELEDKIHASGIQANELRQKIFELGIEQQKAIKELQDSATAREEQYETDLAEEVAHREIAEHTIEDRNSAIAGLETQLAHVTEDRDAIILEKNRLAEEQLASINELQDELSTVKKNYEEVATEKENELAELQAQMEEISRGVDETAAYVKELQDTVASQNAQILDSNNYVADLEEHLEIAHGKIEILEGKETELGRNLEDEKATALELQTELADENKALKTTIEDKEAQIESLEESVELRDRKHMLDINRKAEEIENLRLVAETRAKAIATLSTQLEELKQRFKTQTKASQSTIRSLVDGVRKSVDEATVLAAQHDGLAEREMAAVDAMELEDVHVNVMHDRVSVVKEKGGSGSRGVRDSGIGVEE